MAQAKKGGEVGANTDPVVLLAKADAGAWYYPVGAARLQDLRRQIIGAIADKLSGNNDDSELHSSPNAVQVLVDVPVGTEAGDPIPLAPAVMAAGGGPGRAGNLSVVVGIVAASMAVTMLAGGAANPVVAFGCFLVLLGGLALAMAQCNDDDSELHSSPNAVQVLVDASVGTEASDPIYLAPAVMAAGGGRGHGGNLSVVVGIIAASSAVTALAGGAVSPAVTFGFFVVLLGGLALVIASVRT